MGHGCVTKARKSTRKDHRGESILATRVEKEYLKPSYTASIGEELEDGLFYGNHCNNCILYDPFESWAHLS